MKLKIIRPNTVIHCKTREESECLLNELHKSGIKWRGGESLKEHKFDADSPLGTGYWLSGDMGLEWAKISYFMNRTVEYGQIIPFSSLVIEEKTYEDGLNDAWECAKKISLESFSYQGALTDEELKEAFGTFDLEKIMRNNVVDVIAKLEAYESENQIKVGDVVMYTKTQFVVTCVEGGFIRGIDKLGGTNCYVYPNSLIKKTGKHIDISSVLAEIGKE